MAIVVTAMRQLVLLFLSCCFFFLFSCFPYTGCAQKVSSGATADFPEITELAEFLPAGLGKGQGGFVYFEQKAPEFFFKFLHKRRKIAHRGFVVFCSGFFYADGGIKRFVKHFA